MDKFAQIQGDEKRLYLPGSQILTPEYAYFTLRWPIFPCRENKLPAVKWREYQKRLPTPEEVERWIKESYPLWAVATGRLPGFFALDFDPPEGVLLAEKWNIDPDVMTPSGGYHKYINYPEWIPQNGRIKTLTSGALPTQYAGLDIRADGGCVIFYGETEKGAYKWLHLPK